MKRLIAILLTALMIMMCFTACQGKNAIAGTWSSTGNVPNNYPGVMTLREDGTGLADGYNLNWYTEGNELVLSVGLLGKFSYTYKLHGDSLELDGFGYVRN